MITKPNAGWCNFTIGDFKGTPSYLTDIPCDLLDAFLDYHKKGSGTAVFDEEGSFFTLVLTAYNLGIFIIEEKDKAVLYDFSEQNISDLEKELIRDIETDINGWTAFITSDESEDLEEHKTEIMQKLKELKSIILKTK